MQMVQDDSGEAVMVMQGIPPWLFGGAVAAILVLSFLLVERIGSRRPSDRFRLNLIRNKRVYRIVKSRRFQAIPQLLAVATLAFIVYAGLFGARVGNIAPVAVWTLWWAGLIFVVAVFGPAFCFACPWDGVANLVTRLRSKVGIETLSMGLRVPKALRSMVPAIALFTVLTWAELGLGITTDPRGTAIMGLGMAALALGCALVFENKAFCHYLCPVGRISGVYANFSPVEVRARNPRACRTCTTEDCKNGNDRGHPCPTGISLKVVGEATHCTMCSECVKSCPRHNVALNVRPFGADLDRMAPAPDVAWMCLMLLTLTLFHGLSMTTTWESFIPGQWSLLKWMTVELHIPRMASFTVAMAVAVAIPVLLYRASCAVAARLTAGSGVDTRTLWLSYAPSLLPIALFYHLAHNAMHLLMEGGAIVPMLSDPLGTGADYFGTAEVVVGHLVSDGTIWTIQVGLIVLGHLMGITVAHRISRRLYSDPAQATRSLVPMMAIMVLISVVGVSLMVMDMNMRVGRM